jgi:hypothetical protein
MIRRLALPWLALHATLLAGETAIDVGDRKQLFIDRRFVLGDRGIELRMNPPAKAGPAITPEKPWETGRVFAGGTVLEDGGRYRMWYMAAPPFVEYDRIFLCYAESQDGVTWEKPNLGIHTWNGSSANNIVVEANTETGTVFIDPKAPAAERYKLVGTLAGKHEGVEPGMYLYTSPDGLRWRLRPTRLFPFRPDTQNQAFYDEHIRKYVIYVRVWDPLRKVGRIETDDILAPWPYDRTAVSSRKDYPGKHVPLAFGYDESDPVESDHYTSAVAPYPWADDAYFMFPSAYLHFPPPPRSPFRNDGPVDIQMAVSRDGVSFQRVERRPYVELGLAGSRDSGSMYMLPGLIRHGNEVFQYYGGYTFTHAAYVALPKQGMGTVFRLAQRLDGFVSADAGMAGGSFETPLLRFRGSRLVLNANASAMGEIRVELQDAEGSPIAGRGFEACDPIHMNDLAHRVSWNGSADLGALSSRPLRLAFRLRAAKLYSFQFVE